MSPNRPTLAVVGLDGASFTVLQALFAQGLLPNLQRLLNTGAHADLYSIDPIATLPAWSSLLTGLPPAQHGITDFWTLTPGTYSLTPRCGALGSQPNVLTDLDAAGCKVAALGIPGTFPPLHLKNGLCIAGFDSADGQQAGPSSVYPPPLLRTLNALGGWHYNVINEFQTGRAALLAQHRALLADLEIKERIALRLLQEEGPFDLFFLHLQATDTAGHHFWHTWDPNSPRYLPNLAHLLPQIYQRVDALIGQLERALPAHAQLLIVSDHGMAGASNHALHLNALLAELGYFTFPRRQPAATALLKPLIQRLPPRLLRPALKLWHRLPFTGHLGLNPLSLQGRMIASQTAAFSYELDYAPSIWLNRADRFPQGILSPAQADALTQRLAQQLRSLTYPGSSQPLFADVRTRDCLPQGPFLGQLPDLLLQPTALQGYRPSILRSSGPGPFHTILSASAKLGGKGFGTPGIHARAGVFIWAKGPLAARRLPSFCITQVASILYAGLGQPLPAHLTHTKPPWLRTVPRDPLPEARLAAHSSNMSAAAAAAMAERLASLGYIDA